AGQRRAGRAAPPPLAAHAGRTTPLHRRQPATYPRRGGAGAVARPVRRDSLAPPAVRRAASDAGVSACRERRPRPAALCARALICENPTLGGAGAVLALIGEGTAADAGGGRAGTGRGSVPECRYPGVQRGRAA